MKPKNITCNDCGVLVINNIICHELGCPSSWKDKDYECKECGSMFKPEYKHQQHCSQCEENGNDCY